MPAETAVRTAATTEPAHLQAGPLDVEIADGRLRLLWSAVEVVRQIDAPIRDADWRTLAVEALATETRPTDRGFAWQRRFRTSDAAIAGTLSVEARADATGGTLTADLTLTAARPVEVNRAGFILLHPIAGVAGTPLAVRHSDGSSAVTAFPARISPGQPVFDIAGLRHAVGGVEVAIDFEGETFEMEDQRNWTDASFKTYCRPLSRPRPYQLEPGTPVRQRIRVTLTPTATAAAAAVAASGTAVMPRVLLAHEPELGGTPSPALAALPLDGLILRVDGRAPTLALPVAVPVTLEIVTDHDPAAALATVAAACRGAGIAPRRVVALPRAYLASHQPQGPWPDGPRPMDLVPLVRAAFPSAEAGGGMLTNFTEFNRCPPDPAAIDFATFGTTAIVHAADDRAVIETLEALPQVFDSARALVPGRPLHLGLVAIGMRSNPYGAAVAANPEGRRIAMAMDDPRQRERFAGAFAIGAAAAAARAGVASFAPAMCAGPLGLGPDAAWPLREAVAGLAVLGGARVTIEGGPTGALLVRGARGGLAANLGLAPAQVAGRQLAPMDFAVLGPAA